MLTNALAMSARSQKKRKRPAHFCACSKVLFVLGMSAIGLMGLLGRSVVFLGDAWGLRSPLGVAAPGQLAARQQRQQQHQQQQRQCSKLRTACAKDKEASEVHGAARPCIQQQQEQQQKQQQTMDKETIVLAGPSGSGKSTVGCALAGSFCFNSSDGLDSHTLACKQEVFLYNGTLQRVVDTIGIFDTRMPPEKMWRSWYELADHVNGRVNCFIYVLPWGRFTDEQVKSLQAFENACGGPQVWAHTLLLFTKCGAKTGSRGLEELSGCRNKELKSILELAGAVKCVELESWVKERERPAAGLMKRVVRSLSLFGSRQRRQMEAARQTIHEGVREICSSKRHGCWSSQDLSEALALRLEVDRHLGFLRPEIKAAMSTMNQEMIAGGLTKVQFLEALQQAEDEEAELQLQEEEARRSEERRRMDELRPQLRAPLLELHDHLINDGRCSREAFLQQLAVAEIEERELQVAEEEEWRRDLERRVALLRPDFQEEAKKKKEAAGGTPLSLQAYSAWVEGAEAYEAKLEAKAKDGLDERLLKLSASSRRDVEPKYQEWKSGKHSYETFLHWLEAAETWEELQKLELELKRQQQQKREQQRKREHEQQRCEDARRQEQEKYRQHQQQQQQREEPVRGWAWGLAAVVSFGLRWLVSLI